jgi:hypothetical protein
MGNELSLSDADVISESNQVWLRSEIGVKEPAILANCNPLLACIPHRIQMTLKHAPEDAEDTG